MTEDLNWQIEAETAYGHILKHGTRSITPHLPWIRATAQQIAPRYILELGTGRAHSTLALALGAPQAHIISIDLIGRKSGARRILQNRGKIDFVVRDVWSFEDIGQPDLLFIDDDHTYSQVRKELEVFAPHVGTCILMHDTHIKRKDADVGRALHEWKATTEGEKWTLLWDNPAKPGITALIRKS